MTWRTLLQTPEESVVIPWVGGRVLRGSDDRVWSVDGRLPQEFGWYRFTLNGRKARLAEAVPAEPANLVNRVVGYLVGDRIVPDSVRVDPDPKKIIPLSERVYLIEDGLDRFVRVSAGRAHEGGPLVYDSQQMPLGPEDDVLTAYLDERADVGAIKGVPPALDAAFRLESFQRAEANRRRLEEERKRREEEERLAQEERRRRLLEQLGDGAGRRAMAAVDFEQAARAALAVGGAVYLDSRKSPNENERVVRFRLDQRRFECVCNVRTLNIIDAGVCLIDHANGDIRGDTWFTLESLPGVIREAERERRLVVFRHVR